MDTPKQESGGKRMVRKGRKPVLLGLTKEQVARIDRAKKIAGFKFRTEFITHQVLTACDRIISGKS